MKAWTDLDSIAMPERIARLPKDERGYPVQVTAGKGTDGKIDFRAINMNAWANCVKLRRCGICGEPLGANIAFVGGPISMDNRGFVDAGMHRDCARYACQVCPFIAAPRFAYARTIPALEGHEMSVHESVSTKRPDYFGLGVTKFYDVRANGPEEIVLVAAPWKSLEWWKEGVGYASEPK